MSNDKPTPEEEANPTPPEGSETEDDSKKDEEFLKRFNELDGGSYTSVEAVEKALKEKRKALSDLGRKNKETNEAKDSPVDVYEEMLFFKNPEAKEVDEDLKEVAKSKYNGNVLEAWREESWLSKKATSLFEDKKRKEELENKSSAPDSMIIGDGKAKLNLSDADKALLRARGLSEEDVINNINKQNG